ncbi:MAG TPA: phage terminase small subunit P27 family [Rhizomicrobium sp.]|nr:phage terminase small subunit P27 family [Rhizomicrobium sp.]
MLEGNKGKRALPQSEPEPPLRMPSCPDYLNAYAQAEWTRVAQTLYSIGTLAEIDQTMLAAYCLAYSRWQHAEEDLERMAQTDASTHAAVIRTKQGNLIQNPMVGVANTAMQRLAAEFGLSPSARTQITADPLLNDPISRKYFTS